MVQNGGEEKENVGSKRKKGSRPREMRRAVKTG